MNLKNDIEQYIPYDLQEAKEQEVMLKYLSNFDNLLTRENEFAHLTASAWIVNPERTKVLMAYHNIYQSWSWIGGHADGNADLLEVALKETTEETGLVSIAPIMKDIYSLEILGVPSHIKKGNPIATHLHLNVTYLIEANETEETTVKTDENSAIKWMELTEAVEACTEPEMKVVYKKLNDKLKS
ncbi:ADP-ribose pyrophosphatase YjhB, NUDIX family [Carnobacterium alterfunditum]|uniref:ADP-ribose pyrophosphatase YjhB, NUDIX family n=1 Tax=Carnobacterium alterfunditum TaxID=28230 RepID=A0A1N6FB76_9LACT|nr:NUDIX hydrolase [Carnobacterium alterfunditum]SIN92519.1 ADP-ribose pyrophosphatase YjhB, NUDIX family [Carnobacterium alterfunditum]